MAVPTTSLVSTNSNPDLVLGLVISVLVIIGQARTRLWVKDRNSSLPVIVLAMGLLIYFGYKSSVGPLSPQQNQYMLGTFVVGLAVGILRARTIMIWNEPAGLSLRGTPGTLVLWILTVGGGALYMDFGNLTFSGFVLYLGITYLVQQIFVIIRGIRASRSLALAGAASPIPASPDGTPERAVTSVPAAGAQANGIQANGSVRVAPTDPGTVAHSP